MIWSTTAKEIQDACKAGLVLSEPDEYGTPEWIGTTEQFVEFMKLATK